MITQFSILLRCDLMNKPVKPVKPKLWYGKPQAGAEVSRFEVCS